MTISKSTISRHIADFNYSLKMISRQPFRRNDEQSLEYRYKYAEEFIRLMSLNFNHNFIFIDEVGVNLLMRAIRGRAPIGQTPVVRILCLRSRNISMCCAKNCNGIVHYQCQTKFQKSFLVPKSTIAFILYFCQFRMQNWSS